MLRGYKLWLTLGVAAAVLAGVSIDLPGFHSESEIEPPYPAGVVPNAKQTPGAVNPAISESIIREPGFRTKDYRDVGRDEKMQVAQEYGIPWSKHKLYEFDHYISLEIGGSNDIKNIWPEPLHLDVDGLDLGSKTKDKVEDALGEMVKSGRMSLVEAQSEILDWPKAYEKYIGAFPAFAAN